MARGFWPLADAGNVRKTCPWLSDPKDLEVPLPRIWVRGYTSQLECRWSHLQKDGRLMTASHDGWHWNIPSSPMMGLPTQPAGPWSVVVPGVIDPEELSPESRLNPPTNTTTGNSGSCGKEAAAATISSLVPAWPVARPDRCVRIGGQEQLSPTPYVRPRGGL